MDLNRYIQHPELLDRDTLYILRSYVALYPCHQTARLLMLRNLYLLHDPAFDEELAQAAFFMTDRTVLYNMVEARHHELVTEEKRDHSPSGDAATLTDSLIDSFLDTVEKEEKPKRKPTIADATVDYMSYMLAMKGESEAEQKREKEEKKENKSESIIEDFLAGGSGRISISESPSATDDAPHNKVVIENDMDELEEDYFTENLAKIYVRQGNYLKALEIIKILNLNNSKKSCYFADQMRFLEKIILVKEQKQAKQEIK